MNGSIICFQTNQVKLDLFIKDNSRAPIGDFGHGLFILQNLYNYQ